MWEITITLTHNEVPVREQRDPPSFMLFGLVEKAGVQTKLRVVTKQNFIIQGHDFSSLNVTCVYG